MLASNPAYGIGHFLLRAGVAFAFLYPPLAALSDPIAWAGYFPDFVASLPIDSIVLLHLFGALEVVIAAWLLWGRKPQIPATLAAVLLLGIVAANLNDFANLFRDVSLALTALALVFLPEPSSRTIS